MEAYERYLQQHSPRLQAEQQSIFGESVVAFRTLLEVLEEFSGKVN